MIQYNGENRNVVVNTLAKVILVASGKGGAGKSTVSALLGEALAFSGHPTVIFELDSGLRSLDVALSTTENVVFDMGDAQRGSSLYEIAVPCPFCKNLYLVSASAAFCEIKSEVLSRLIAEADEKFEFVIMDCPAGLGNTLAAAAEKSDTALIVATPDPSSIRAAGAASDFIRQKSNAELRLIIERCPQKAKKLEPIESLDEIIDGASARLIGILWDDPLTRKAIDSGTALPYGSPNKKMIGDIAERLLGKRILLDFK